MSFPIKHSGSAFEKGTDSSFTPSFPTPKQGLIIAAMANHIIRGAANSKQNCRRHQRPPSYASLMTAREGRDNGAHVSSSTSPSAAHNDRDDGVLASSSTPTPYILPPSYSPREDDLEAGRSSLTPSSIGSEDITPPRRARTPMLNPHTISPPRGIQSTRAIDIPRVRPRRPSPGPFIPLVAQARTRRYPLPSPSSTPSSSSLNDRAPLMAFRDNINRPNNSTTSRHGTRNNPALEANREENQARSTLECCIDSLLCAVSNGCAALASLVALIITRHRNGWGCSHPEISRFLLFLGIGTLGLGLHALASGPAETRVGRFIKIFLNCIIPYLVASACLGVVTGWDSLCPVSYGET
ncbi:hypothetical protein B0A52_05376 [Exophiala mesophila]|uniref:Uncharacterized protein n=1 Tax=Exophiala mesophila TaxID=212818 RepID=A0A438N4R2_EXOME|nr:hypothetical protein B0A52_05376 [Exophiala mesophila]